MITTSEMDEASKKRVTRSTVSNNAAAMIQQASGVMGGLYNELLEDFMQENYAAAHQKLEEYYESITPSKEDEWLIYTLFGWKYCNKQRHDGAYNQSEIDNFLRTNAHSQQPLQAAISPNCSYCFSIIPSIAAK